ncbi:MAG: riboflavin synthase [Gemmatimonadales bacterium]
MFSGIVEGVGKVRRLAAIGASARLRVHSGVLLMDARVGDSIAVSGVCLTIAATTGPEFEADLSVETIRRTTLGGLTPGGLVNLERPLRLDQRIGGHVVQGHVDGVGTIAVLRRNGQEAWMEIRLPDGLRPYVVEKGSVAVDGVSLTIAEVSSTGAIGIALIPHTIAVTTLGQCGPGDGVNLEVDVLAKYVSRYLKELTHEGKGYDRVRNDRRSDRGPPGATDAHRRR